MNIFEAIEKERWVRGRCGWTETEWHNASIDRITEAAKELQAQVPKTVKPEYGQLGMYCPNCGSYIEKHWKACHCGAKLDWSKEDA